MQMLACYFASGSVATVPDSKHDFLYLQVLPQLAGDRVNVHYTVKDVQVSPHEKILRLVGSYTQEQVVVHLQDGWHETPVEAGHSVNLIAEKTVGSDGLLHATCDFNAGKALTCYAVILSSLMCAGLFSICRCPFATAQNVWTFSLHCMSYR